MPGGWRSPSPCPRPRQAFGQSLREKGRKPQYRKSIKPLLTGAASVTMGVFLFAVCLIADFPFGAYFVCLFLPMAGVFSGMAGAKAAAASSR